MDDDTYIRSAKFRAAAVSYVNTLTELTPSGHVLEGMRDTITKLGIDDHAAAGQLRDLAIIGLIGYQKEGKRNFSYIGKGVDPAPLRNIKGTGWKKKVSEVYPTLVTPEALEAVVRQPYPTERSSQRVAKDFISRNITVDVVKSTGRIRLTFGGISIDFGVVEE